MFNDIVICELMHNDPQNCEFCNPQEIVVGTSNDGGILFSMLFKNEEERKQKYSSVEGEYALEVFAEVIDNNDIAFKEKYDVQTGIKLTIIDDQETYKMIIGSNGDNFHYFTNVPAINNTTSFGDVLFLNFNHTVEAFTYTDSDKKIFKQKYLL